MARHFCPRCGLSLRDGEAAACARCSLIFAAADPERANFDEASGAPLGGEPVRLRCWHCGEAIAQDTVACPACGTKLDSRAFASVRFDVVGTRPSTTPAVPPAVVDAPAEDVPRSGNYFVRHWRGELPLAVSFWVNLFLASIALNVALLLAQRPFTWSDDGIALFATSLGMWLVRVLIGIWQVVGIWRSAGASIRRRKRDHRTYFWAVIARVWLALIVVGAGLGVAIYGVPTVQQNFAIAFREDPEVTPYAIEVVPDGTAVVVIGGIRYGIANDLAAVLDNNPAVTMVYLASPGGRMGPGGALFRLIRDRRLSTYALGPCYSACTIAFAGGVSRGIGLDGELGFHSPSLDGERLAGMELALSVDVFQPYREAGFAESIIFRARATAPDDLWVPTDSVLLAGGVLTRPRDAAARPAGVPVAAYLQLQEAMLAPILPIPLTENVVIESVEADGNRLTMVFAVDRSMPLPPNFATFTDPAMLCAAIGNMEGAILVLVARYSDGEEIVRSEFDSAGCAV